VYQWRSRSALERRQPAHAWLDQRLELRSGPDGNDCDEVKWLRHHHQIYLPAATSKLPVSRISSEPEPIITLNFPGSTTKCICRSQRARSWGFKIKVTVLVSPGWR